MKEKGELKKEDIEILQHIVAAERPGTPLGLDIFRVKPWGLVTVNYYYEKERVIDDFRYLALDSLTTPERELYHIRAVLERPLWKKHISRKYLGELQMQFALHAL